MPTWVTSSTTSISLEWTLPVDDGGCPIQEIRLFRNDGVSTTVIDTEVNNAELATKNYIRSIDVTDFPLNSIGSRFLF